MAKSSRQPALVTRYERVELWLREQFLPSFKSAWSDFFVRDRVPNLAASLAFFALVSMIPLLILITAALGYVMAGSEQAYQGVLDLITKVAPQSVTDIFPLINDLIAGKFTAGWIGVIVLFWAGSRVFDILESALNRVWNLQKDRPFLRKTGLALVLIPGMVLFLGVSLGISTLFSITRRLEVPWFQIQLADIPFLWDIMGVLLPISLSVVGFYLVYRLIAATKVHRKDALIGALTASILWEALKFGYDYYVTHIWNVNQLYGGLGTLVIFVIWVYLSCMVLLFGAEVAFNWQRISRERHETFEYFNPMVE